MAIEWSQRIKLRSGVVGYNWGVCPITKKHRIETSNRGADYGKWGDKESTTIWLLDGQGRCRGDKAPSAYDYASAA